jgi:hypothetical protein
MIGLLRLLIFGFVALTIVYGLVWVYSRSIRREKLENKWAEMHPDGGDVTDRDTYIAEGMADYRSGIRPKLILLVYILPTLAVLGILIATNWN